MKQKKVIFINTKERTVEERMVSELEEMQALVGGYIERAHIFKNGDEVYVNEEGLFDNSLSPFFMVGCPHPYVGNGYIIGKVTPSGNNRSVKMTLEEVKKLVVFL